MNDQTRHILQRFVDKAHKLNDSRFVHQLAAVGNSVRVGSGRVDHIRPDDEALAAFLLTFRFFIMQNEQTSFRSLSSLLDNPDISDAWKQQFAWARGELNRYWQEQHHMDTTNYV